MRFDISFGIGQVTPESIPLWGLLLDRIEKGNLE